MNFTLWAIPAILSALYFPLSVCLDNYYGQNKSNFAAIVLLQYCQILKEYSITINVKLLQNITKYLLNIYC